MAAPKPPAELSQLAFLLGDWACMGKTFASPIGPEHATVAKVSSRRDLGGWWISFRYEELKSAANPAPYQAAGVLGYDPGEKVFLERCQDSMGGSCQQSSPGWAGDVLTFEGPGIVGGQKLRFRDTFTRKGGQAYVHAGEFQGPDGQWIKTDEETCTRKTR
jgi:hypothetical protein